MPRARGRVAEPWAIVGLVTGATPPRHLVDIAYSDEWSHWQGALGNEGSLRGHGFGLLGELNGWSHC